MFTTSGTYTWSFVTQIFHNVNQGTNVSKYFVDNSVFDIYRGLFQLSTNIIGVKARNCNKFDYIAQCTGANKFII